MSSKEEVSEQQKVDLIKQIDQLDLNQLIEFIEQDDQSFQTILDLRKVGFHTRKLKTLSESISEFIKNSRSDISPKPCQMFLREPKSGRKAKIGDGDIKRAADLIKNFGIPFFVHSAYCINLSDPCTKKDPSDKFWALNLLKEDLQLCQQLGGRGVVVHVGKHKTMSVEQGLAKMKESILYVLPYATVECPLLLETPASQGTELCSKIEEFLEFYLSFSEDERKVLMLVPDTQHVFSSGYQPIDYLKCVVENLGVSALKLIHLNDSKIQLGGCKDRHQQLGRGYIGAHALQEIIEWANLYDIPMVIE